MKTKKTKHSFIILLIILTVTFAGCSDKEAANGNIDNPDNSVISSVQEELTFDYGIKINPPADWETDTYEIKETDEWFMPVRYGLQCDFISNGSYRLFSLYVMDWVDWNDYMLSSAYGVTAGEDIRMSGDLAYIITDLPQENPLEEKEAADRFQKMSEAFTENSIFINNGLISISPEGGFKPEKTKSVSKTVECDFDMFMINIPTSWDYRLIKTNYAYDAEVSGYTAAQEVCYSLLYRPDEYADLFKAYVFTNEVWEQIEAGADGGPTGFVKVSSNAVNTLAVILPQENPLEADSDISKTFDEMQSAISDLESFFKLY